MNVEIRRQTETATSVCGEMWIDGQFECFTLEPSRDTPVHPGHPCIPAGTYDVVLTLSPHLGYICPEVLDVPGRTAIRWHIGNFPADVLGCVVVGTEQQPDAVLHSKLAFGKMMDLLNGAVSAGDKMVATYVDPGK